MAKLCKFLHQFKVLLLRTIQMVIFESKIFAHVSKNQFWWFIFLKSVYFEVANYIQLFVRNDITHH